MANNAELTSRVENLEHAVAKLTKLPASAPAVGPTVRPPATSADQAKEYAYEGYANDGVQRRWLGTHPGNLDEARAQALATPAGWASPVVYGILVLSDFLPTAEERAASVASGGGLSDTLTRWDATATEDKTLSTDAWWAEVVRRRIASSGTPDGGASGDRG